MVASLPLMNTSFPQTTPTPHTRPPPWIIPSYMPRPTRGAISRKGVLRSKRRSSFSRIGIFPWDAMRSLAFCGRSSRAIRNSSFSSVTRASMASKFLRYSSDVVSIFVSITSMPFHPPVIKLRLKDRNKLKC